MLTAAATLEIEQDGQVVRGQREAGLASLKAPAKLGRPVFRIIRDGEIVVELAGKWEITTVTTRRIRFILAALARAADRPESFVSETPKG